MPNWCNNNVDITATTPEQMEILNRIATREKNQGVFEMVLPLPEILRDTTSPTPADLDSVQRNVMIAQTGYDNWYDWQVSNWGTKWDVDPIDEQFDGETLSLCFDSAWAPPITFYERLVEMGFEVSANYYEPGMCFAGEWVNGDDFCIDDVYELARKDTSELSTREYDILEMFGIWEEVAQMDADELELDDGA